MTRSQHAAAHAATIEDQFTRQAEIFAAAPELHDESLLALLVEAASPKPEWQALDVACGPGSVVAAFARRCRHVTGLDATEAMLDQARARASRTGLGNVDWRRGDVYALPFEAGTFDLVTCRFAFHHLLEPAQALAEMVRVCRPGGTILLCDGVAPDDPAKAAAMNRFEKHRDPSTAGMRSLDFHLALFVAAGLPAPRMTTCRLGFELESLIAKSFPEGDDRDFVRRLVEESIPGDGLGMNARGIDGRIHLAYPVVIWVAEKRFTRA